MTDNTVQHQLAKMLLEKTGDTAYQRLEAHARKQKQSVQEAALRVASNLLNSLVVHKPDGYV